MHSTIPATARCPTCGWANTVWAKECQRCGTKQPAFDATLQSYRRTAGAEWPQPPAGFGQGETIADRYRIGPLLGYGGAAMVFEALDVQTRRGVALKVLQPKTAQVEEGVRRFRREAEVQAGLRHPAIVALLDFLTVGKNLVIVSELARGPSLAQRLADDGPLATSQAVRVFLEVLAALEFAHAHGVIHRDLKPANVLFDRMGRGACAKLTDFGLAKVLASADGLTRTGTQLGTYWYMAPEQIRSARRVDARTDIYSLGVTMFHVLTGRVPFDAKQPWEVANAHAEVQPPDPLTIKPTIPRLLSDVVLQCLAKDPDDRFQSAGAVRQALRAL